MWWGLKQSIRNIIEFNNKSKSKTKEGKLKKEILLIV